MSDAIPSINLEKLFVGLKYAFSISILGQAKKCHFSLSSFTFSKVICFFTVQIRFEIYSLYIVFLLKGEYNTLSAISSLSFSNIT